MSWVFPRWREVTGGPMGSEPLNQNFRVFVEEVEGRLGEHNWNSAASPTFPRASVDNDAVLRVFHAKQAYDPDLESMDGVVGKEWPTHNFSSALANAFRLSNNAGWDIISPLFKTWVSDSPVTLDIHASFQQDAGLDPQDAVLGYWLVGFPGAQYAARVNGNIIAESIIGGLDRANDRKGEAISQDMWAVVVECVVDAPPGEITVEIVGRVAHGDLWARLGDQLFIDIFNRELVIIEMR